MTCPRCGKPSSVKLALCSECAKEQFDDEEEEDDILEAYED
jgi:NMD protein affecting ribosome stability and mRNA decay